MKAIFNEVGMRCFEHRYVLTLRWAVMVGGLACMGMAGAAMAEPTIELTPFIGYHAGGQFKDSNDAKVSVNASSSAAFAFNWPATEPGTQYELFYSRQSTDVGDSAAVKLKTEYLQIGGTTVIGEPTSRVVPFAVGGVGATRFSPDAAAYSQETRWAFNLGGGVRVPISEHVRLRFEARGYLTWLGGNANLFCDSGCALVAKGKTFLQYEALGGVSVGF